MVMYQKYQKPGAHIWCLRNLISRNVAAIFKIVFRRGSAPLQKSAKCVGFVAVSKPIAGVGLFKEDLQRCISRDG